MFSPLRAAVIAATTLVALPASADDKLLNEAVAFTGQIFFLQSGVPGLVIAAVRDGERVVHGFGEVKKDTGKAPDGDTRIGVGSITKTFTGLSLATVVTDAKTANHLKLTDPAGPWLDPKYGKLPERDGQPIRFVDLATHSSGLPRELEEFPDVEKYSDESFKKTLASDPLLFNAGEGILYSNVGFDILAMTLAKANSISYYQLSANIRDNLGLKDTTYERPDPSNANVFQGYDWNGNPMDAGPAIPNRAGASGLTTTPNDMIRYLEWNLDRFGTTMPEERHLAHAAHLMRDGLDPVYGMDESGHMNAMALGWVIMMPQGDRPLIIQKAGGSNGIFSYIAFAPTRGVGVFISINEFDFAAGMEIATIANDLIATLAPR